MEKIMLYNLYANENIDDNKTLKIHQLCIEHYKHMFDKIMFNICVDDLHNIELINNLTKWVTKICKGLIYEIYIRKNTYLCESNTFKELILNKRHNYKDTFIFICHSKNINNLDKNMELKNKNSDYLSLSLVKWIIALYFYGLNFEQEIEKKLFGVPKAGEIFYGPLLTQLKDKNSSPMLRINNGNCFYNGTFYWINMNKFNNYLDRDIIKLPEVDDRYWLEMLPGVIGGRYNYGDGCTSHNDIAINDDFNLYIMNDSEWEYLIKILGNDVEFWDFYNNIINNI